MHTSTDKNKTLFGLTPITIMLTSSVFVLAFSLFGMTNINTLMLETIKEQEHSSFIHSNIFTGITKRSQALFKIINNKNSLQQSKALISEIEYQKSILAKNQLQCIHNKTLPMNDIFIKQAKMLKYYTAIESKVVQLFQQGKKERAFSLFTSELRKQKENTLNQIIVGKNFIHHTSNNTVKRISDKTIYGILIYGLINILLIAFSLYFSIRIFNRYISNNKSLMNSTRLDLLTNLSNRLHFLEEVNEQITKHPDSTFAVAFIDIDYFKSINDIYGHTLADNLLIKFGHKLSLQLKGIDHCLARFGGDEFVLLIKDTNNEKIDLLINNLAKAVNTNYHPQEKTIGLTSSIGVSLYPDDATSIEMLLHNSDLAMYQAKQDGRSCYRLFSKQLKSELLIKNEVSQRLQTCLSNNEDIFLVYQPLLNTKTCSVTECEALLRWHDSKLGNVSPDIFIPIAEKTNLIKSVNYFVIDEACNQQYKWVNSGTTKIRININLSGNQDIFISSLKRLIGNIHRLKLSPSLFGIEITERSLFEINTKTVNQLKIINEMGISVSIDDFGTGYSSLLYLAKLPLTTLKIDKEFISNICNKEKDNAIILSIIKLGQALGLDIVAEGVETRDQCEYLKQHSCDVIQGYLFSKPVTPDKLECIDTPILEQEAQQFA